MLRCSPVCEKQALFALFQSYKENNIEEQLIKKVLDGGAPPGMEKTGHGSSDACVCVCVRCWAVCAASSATAA